MFASLGPATQPGAGAALPVATELAAALSKQADLLTRAVTRNAERFSATHAERGKQAAKELAGAVGNLAGSPDGREVADQWME